MPVYEHDIVLRFGPLHIHKKILRPPLPRQVVPSQIRRKHAVVPVEFRQPKLPLISISDYLSVSYPLVSTDIFASTLQAIQTHRPPSAQRPPTLPQLPRVLPIDSFMAFVPSFATKRRCQNVSATSTSFFFLLPIVTHTVSPVTVTAVVVLRLGLVLLL